MAKKVTRVIKNAKKKSDDETVQKEISENETSGNSSDVSNVETVNTETINNENQTDLQAELKAVLGDGYGSESETPAVESEPELPKKSSRKKALAPVTPEPKKIIIPGRLVVKMSDKIFSRAITSIDALFSKDAAIDPGMLQSDDDQLEDLIPMAEKMVESWKLEEHPTLFFLGSMLMIHISNYTMVKALLKKKIKDEKRATTERP